MKPLRLYYQSLLLWLDAQKPRTRIMFLLISLLGVYLLWDLLIWQSILKTQRAVTAELTTLNAQLEITQQQLQATSSSKKSPAYKRLLQQYQNLEAQSQSVQESLASYQQQPIDAGRFTYTLKELLKKNNDLRLLRLESAEDKPKSTSNSVKLPLDGDISPYVQAEFAADLGLMVRQHIVLELEGKYFSVLNYLQRLEALNWQIFWDNLDYQVTEQSIGRARIQLHTLSLKEDSNV